MKQRLYLLTCMLLFCSTPSNAQTATIHCYSKTGCTSFMESNPPREFVIGDPSLKNAFLQHRSVSLQEILAMPPMQVEVKIHYDPTVFADEAALIKTQYTDAKAEKYSQAIRWRHKTKHRDITSIVNCIGNGFAETVEAFPLTVTTGVGYNFMGSSPGDEFLYVQDGKLKDRLAYQHSMQLLFQRWLASLDAAQVEIAVIPMISGGVYVKKLNSTHKALARESIQTALMHALEAQPLEHIKEVIHVVPNTQSGQLNAMYLTGQRVFSDYQGQLPLTLVNADFFETAEFAYLAGYRVGLLNPGSDRTLGGKFMHFLTVHADGNYTLEEIIFNLTDAVHSQPLDTNTNQPSYHVYPAALWHDRQTTMPCTPADQQDVWDNSRLAKQIQYRLFTDKVAIYDGQNQAKQIQFTSSIEAQRLLDMLSAQGIAATQQTQGKSTIVTITAAQVEQFDLCF